MIFSYKERKLRHRRADNWHEDSELLAAELEARPGLLAILLDPVFTTVGVSARPLRLPPVRVPTCSVTGARRSASSRHLQGPRVPSVRGVWALKDTLPVRLLGQ